MRRLRELIVHLCCHTSSDMPHSGHRRIRPLHFEMKLSLHNSQHPLAPSRGSCCREATEGVNCTSIVVILLRTYPFGAQADTATTFRGHLSLRESWYFRSSFRRFAPPPSRGRQNSSFQDEEQRLCSYRVSASNMLRKSRSTSAIGLYEKSCDIVITGALSLMRTPASASNS